MVFVVSFLGLSQSGCEPVAVSVQSCQSHADCLGSFVCVEQVCRQTCNYNRDCASDLQCFDGACVPRQGSADSGATDAARLDSAIADVVQRDSASLMDSTGADAVVFDRATADSALDAGPGLDVNSQDAAEDPCLVLSCPENMTCESSGANTRCLCDSVECVGDQACLLPQSSSVHGGDITPICCAPSLHNCIGQCVDFATDEDNCGACDQACNFGETCLSSSCDCGGHGPCTADQDCCDGLCIDVLSDRDNCGAPGSGAGCGHICSGGQPCTNGACGCGIASDCGAGDWSCDSGNCVCAGVVCQGSCVADGDCCADNDCNTTDQCSSWGSCESNDFCAERGTQTRSCPQLSCSDNSCVQTWADESQSCSRDTEGLSCGGALLCCAASCTCTNPSVWLPRLAAGDSHSCAISAGGALYCWGNNDKGQLGVSTAPDTSSSSPIRVGSASDWSGIVGGRTHSCGLRSGSIWCWGENGNNQLGDGTTTDRMSPVQVSGTNSGWVYLSSSYRHNCGIKSDHSLWCWGYNYRGQIGNNSTSNQSVPLKIATSDWRTVTAGGGHTCAIKTNGELWCWGSNYEGQIGLGDNTGPFKTPTRVGSASDWADVQTGSGYHSCGLKTNGELWCWGGASDNDYRDYGNVPVLVSNTGWKRLALGSYSDYAIHGDGSLWSWGDDEYGRLANGANQSSKSSPYQISTSSDWAYIAGGYSHVCAMDNNNAVYCAGDGGKGRLGNGGTSSSQVFVGVGSPF